MCMVYVVHISGYKIYFPFLKSKFVCLFLVVLGLCSIAGFSLAEASGGYSIVAVLRILIVVASLMGSRHVGFSSCSALGSRVQTQ